MSKGRVVHTRTSKIFSPEILRLPPSTQSTLGVSDGKPERVIGGRGSVVLGSFGRRFLVIGTHKKGRTRDEIRDPSTDSRGNIVQKSATLGL